ncbi:hypothetical protein ABKN59_006254 [Abortiporus biennis]
MLQTEHWGRPHRGIFRRGHCRLVQTVKPVAQGPKANIKPPGDFRRNVNATEVNHPSVYKICQFAWSRLRHPTD